MLQILLLLAVAIQTIAAANSTISSTIVDLAIATPNLSTLVTALKAGDLVKTLQGAGPFTVFAPTDAAFAALPKGVLDNLLQPANKASLDDVLTYHVLGDEVHANKFLDGEMLRTLEGKYVTARVAGSTIFINSAKVTTADVQASNGVIHIIDAVLLPSSAPPSPGPSPAPAPGTENIVQLAQATPSLSTLVTALGAASLVKTLEGTGPFTVFAPTNDAFKNLPAGALANLLLPKNKAKLVDILTFHVVSGSILAADILDGERIKTVEGQYITAAVNSSGVFLNNAQVTTANVNASNGIVHIIDAVLQEWTPTPPKGKSLWFRGYTNGGLGTYQCGEVDASSRMPADIFEPSNAGALQAYKDITIALFGVFELGENSITGLELGRCAEKNYTKLTCIVGGRYRTCRKVIWAPDQLMDGICKTNCMCNYPKCKDVPDDPKAGKWCSLCGPKVNKPFEVLTYRCGGHIRNACPGPGPKTPLKDWLQVLKDLLSSTK